MAKDTLGYPPNSFMRMHLERAWTAAFGALDIGDFDTFLKESADRTYEDALAQIEKIGERQESRVIKGAIAEGEKGGIEQYQATADELRKSGDEYSAGAIESLISDLIAEKSKPKKAARKREPRGKATQLPSEPLPIPTQPSAGQHGKDYSWLFNLIVGDGITDLELAKRELRLDSTDLTEYDREELERIIDRKKKELLEKHGKSKEEILRYVEPKRAEPTKAITGREIFAPEPAGRERRPEGEERVSKTMEDVALRELKKIEREGSFSVTKAEAVAKALMPNIGRIMAVGLRAWFESHPMEGVEVNTKNLSMIAAELIALLVNREPRNLREWIAFQFVEQEGGSLLAHGMDKAIEERIYVLRTLHKQASAQNPAMPDFEKTITDVKKTLLSM